MLNKLEDKDPSVPASKPSQTPILGLDMRSQLQSLLYTLMNHRRKSGTSVILFTDLNECSGVSTIVVNLAKVLSAANGEQDKSVLILDGSGLREERDTQRNRAVSQMVEYFTVGSPVDTLALKNAMPGVDIMHAQLPGEAGIMYMTEEEIIERLSGLKQSYKWVLLDMPEALRPESLRWSSFCDGAIMVMEAGTTRRQRAHSIVQEYRDHEINLFGCILNKRKFQIPEFLYRMMFK